MSDATIRLRNMRTRPGQSLAELQNEVATEAETAIAALKRLQRVSLNYFPADDDEAFQAIQQSNAALALAGDSEALQANRESA